LFSYLIAMHLINVYYLIHVDFTQSLL